MGRILALCHGEVAAGRPVCDDGLRERFPTQRLFRKALCLGACKLGAKQNNITRVAVWPITTACRVMDAGQPN